MSNRVERLLIILLCIFFIPSVVVAASIFQGNQGGTGIGTATTTDTGKALVVASTSPTLTYSFTSLVTSTWTGNIITVPFGGTGTSSLNLNTLLVGNGTSSVTFTPTPSSSQNGQTPVWNGTRYILPTLYSIALPPLTANANDVEFNSTTLPANAVMSSDANGTGITGVVNIFSTISSSSGAIYDLTSTPGWLSVQPSSLDNKCRELNFPLAASLPTSSLLYVRFNVTTRTSTIAGDSRFFMWWANNTSSPSITQQARLEVNNGGTASLNIGGVASQSYVWPTQVILPNQEMSVALVKNTSSYTGAFKVNNGGWFVPFFPMVSTTFQNKVTVQGVGFCNGSLLYPGDMIFKVDYMREIDFASGTNPQLPNE